MFTRQQKTFINIIFFSSLLPSVGALSLLPQTIFGFNLSGWAWIICLLFSLRILLNTNGVKMSFWMWIPLFLYYFIYLLFDYSFYGLQLILQYLTPIVVGIAASTFSYHPLTIRKLFKKFKIIILLTILILLIRYGIGQREFGSETVMTLTIAAVVFLAMYFDLKKMKYFFRYLLILPIPIFLLTRMGIAMTLIVAPLHFANKQVKTKLAMIFLFIIATLFVFNSESFQKKMFLDGQTMSISEFAIDNSALNTNGRSNLAKLMAEDIVRHPYFGNGPRADLALFKENELWIMEAHNDYLSIVYNFGYVGLCLLLFALLTQFYLLYKKLKPNLNKDQHIIITSALTLFIPLFGFMYSDNILKYSSAFGNFHFILIGIVYALILSKPKMNKSK